MKKISVIVPCCNEAEALPLFSAELLRVADEMSGYDFEILFVDDGSADDTLKLVRGYAEKDARIKYISFSRNFGKEAAMYAGFCSVTGDYAAVMDADMQDPPSLLCEMVRIIEQEGYDSVATRRVTRKGEPPVRSLCARLFYKLINRISDADIVDGARDFRLMKREMVNAIISMSEYNRFSKGIFGWIGFKTYWLEYENTERIAGETKWSFWKLFKYSIQGIINFSEAPLSVASCAGIAMTAISFLLIAFIIIRKLIFGDPVAGWPSLVCIITFIGGVQLFCMGIVGQYIAKTYMEVKRRPIYIIRETNTAQENK